MIKLSEVRRLYGLGFAILWIRPRSKAPVETGWTTGERKTWKELKRSFHVEYNVGVRLGLPSRLHDGSFLAVIDCDCKSTELRHRKEMEAALEELGVPTGKGPVVASGRGNGSKHVYIRSARALAPKRLRQSSEKVLVHMPSVSPSKSELRELSARDISKGSRLRPAWEISLMGTGQQVVLPPSIHPDSGKPYIWAASIQDSSSIPHVEGRFGEGGSPDSGNNRSGIEKTSRHFRAEKVNLAKIKTLPKRVVAQIEEGEEIEDRSAALFGVTIALLRSGLSENQVLSVLTDKKNYLGLAAYDHAKTEDRGRAARWLAKYTLPKARGEVSMAKHFLDDYEEPRELSKEEQAKQAFEITGGESAWREELDRAKDGGPPKPTLKNIDTILSHAVGGGIFRRNDFSMRDSYGLETPWGGKVGAELRDDDAVQIKRWLADHFRMEPSVYLVCEAMTVIAMRNSFHPVRRYLERLEWDGVPRLDGWMKTYLSAVGEEPYLSEVGRKVLCAAVARVYRPGIKFDHVLILEGSQGVGKSSAARILASEEWFTDALPDVKDKDSRLNLLGNWIVEISELASLKRADAETYKAFFTAQSDRVRAPYGRRWEEFKRQCIFIGTTNSQDYLNDRTGNRRFWPVEVGQCDFKALARDRDQLFAEARFAWQELGELLYLEGEAKAQAEVIQAARLGEDIESLMTDELVNYEKANPEFGKERFKLIELFTSPGAFEKRREDTHHARLAGKILRQCGYEKYESMGVKFWRKRMADF